MVLFPDDLNIEFQIFSFVLTHITTEDLRQVILSKLLPNNLAAAKPWASLSFIIFYFLIYFLETSILLVKKKNIGKNKTKDTTIMLSWVRGWRTDSWSWRGKPQIKFKLTIADERNELTTEETVHGSAVGADNFPSSDWLSVSKSELSLQKYYLYRLVLKLKKVGDCLIRTGRLFQRGTIR